MFAYFYGPDLGDDDSLLFTFLNTWERGDINPINLQQALLSCLQEFDMDKLIKLDCSLSPPFPEQWYRDLFSRLPALEVLRVECSDNPSGLISALSPGDAEDVTGTSQNSRSIAANRTHNIASNSGDESYPSLLLPSLRQLVFTEANFTASTSCYCTTYEAPYTKGSLKHLAHCIELRKERGSKLELLAIPGTSKESERSGANLRQNVSVLACLNDENVEETDIGFPEVVVHGLFASSDVASDSELDTDISVF